MHQKTGIFTSPEGKSYAITFTLVSSLFLLWGFCNGMIEHRPACHLPHAMGREQAK
jgi:hypothetical protein